MFALASFCISTWGQTQETRVPVASAGTEECDWTDSSPARAWGSGALNPPTPANAPTRAVQCPTARAASIFQPFLDFCYETRSDEELARHVTVINQTFERNYFGNEDPIGQ